MSQSLFRVIQIVIVMVGVLSCTGSNLYKDMASNKNSDEALYEDAQKLIDSGNYTGAINKILATSTGFRAVPKVKESLAGAYAARCGMEFLTFVQNLGNGSSSSFMKIALNGFVGVSTANYADCVTAEGIIEGIGNATARTTSQNFFMLFLEMAKMGNRLRSVADASPATGDGVVDVGFNCRTSVPIADAKAVIDSFSKILENLTALTAAGASVNGVGSISAISAICGTACVTLDYTGGSDPAAADETDPPIILSRALINTQSFGVGTCAGSDLLVCACP